MEFNKFLTAQDVLPKKYEWWSSEFAQGFNIRVYGGNYSEVLSHRINTAGWTCADKLIQNGEIYFVYPFKCDRYEKCPGRFEYGGFWACNSCNTHISTPKWWYVKVMKDGNAWCCLGENFINLQESDNYAFGYSREEALENYRKLMQSTKIYQ